MNMQRVGLLLFWAIAATIVAGCGALSSRSEQGAARFFSLERAPLLTNTSLEKTTRANETQVELRLGRITGANHLEERIVFRSSTYEIGYYRELRWTEPPEQFLKWLLTRKLFEERGLRHVVGAAGPTLDVQLTAFDEILVPQHLARVQVITSLHDENLVLWEETLTVDRPILVAGNPDLAVATIEALGETMHAVVDRIADHVVAQLQKQKWITASTDQKRP